MEKNFCYLIHSRYGFAWRFGSVAVNKFASGIINTSIIEYFGKNSPKYLFSHY